MTSRNSLANPAPGGAALLERPVAASAEPATPRAPRAPWRRLQAAGLALFVAWAGVYVLFFSHTLWQAPTLIPDHWPKIFYPLLEHMPWVWLRAHRDTALGAINVLIWGALLVILFSAWLWAMRAARDAAAAGAPAREGLFLALMGLFVMTLILVVSPGFTSQDVYSYIWYAKMAGVFHVSPFTHAPEFFAFQDYQHWLQWVYWKDQPAVYGPAWVWPAGVLGSIAERLDGDIVTYVLSQRVFAAALHLINTALIWSLAGKLMPAQPGRRLAATIFYGWCPLIVWEFTGNAHNDVWMLTWILVAVWLHLQGEARAARKPGRSLTGWWQAAVVALTVAGLVKAIAFVLIPAYMMLVLTRAPGPRPWRAWIGRSAQAVALVVGVSALLYAPYWEGWATLKVVMAAPGNERYVNSLGQVFRFRGPEILHNLAQALGVVGPEWTVGSLGDWMEGWVRPLAMGVTGVIGLALTLRVRDVGGLLRAWAWMLLAYVLIGAMWFWPWYITWFVPFVALLGPGRLRTATILYAAGGMVLYGLAPTIPVPLTPLQDWTPLLCFGPVALYLLAASLRDLWRARTGAGIRLRSWKPAKDGELQPAGAPALRPE
jgi:hypothetical protein